MAVQLFYIFIEYLGGIISIFINSLLIYLIVTKSNNTFGKYRILMISFSLFSMFFTIVDFIIQPKMLIYRSGLVIFGNTFLKFPRNFGSLLIALYCGSFSCCMGLLCNHFLYRYFVICWPSGLKIYNDWKIIITFFPSVFAGISWFLTLIIGFTPNSINQPFFSQGMRNAYNMNIYETPFVSAVYYVKYSNQTTLINWPNIFGCTGLTIFLVICLAIIIFCSIETFRLLNDMNFAMSNITRKLNRQLLITLFYQTLLPLFTMYIPVGILMLLPIFEIEIGNVINLVNSSISLYPALDPIVALILIDDFRNRIQAVIKRKKIIPTIVRFESLTQHNPILSTQKPIT